MKCHRADEMKTSLECERAETADSGGKGRISFSVDSLLGGKTNTPAKEPSIDANSNDAESTDAAPETDDSDVDIEDVESNAGDERDEREMANDGEEMEGRSGVVVPQPLLPRLYQGPAPPPTWPFGAFPWMAPNPMFRGGSPNSEYYLIAPNNINKINILINGILKFLLRIFFRYQVVVAR